MDILIRALIGAVVGFIVFLLVKLLLGVFGLASAAVLNIIALVIVLGVVLYALGRWNPKV